MTFDEFLAAPLFELNNAWLQEPGLEIYVRKHLFWKGLIVVANVNAKLRGRGAYSRFLDRYDASIPFQFENTVTERLADWHRRRGHFELPDPDFNLPSFLNRLAVERRLGPVHKLKLTE